MIDKFIELTGTSNVIVFGGDLFPFLVDGRKRDYFARARLYLPDHS